LGAEVDEHFSGFDKECGVPVEDGLMQDVLCYHAFPEAVRADENHVVAALCKVCQTY
jgi:hypothetical protein